MNSGWVKEICAKGVWLKDKKREGGMAEKSRRIGVGA